MQIEEETGLDVTDKIQEESSISCWIQDRYHKLYIIPDIALTADIQAKMRREIKVGSVIFLIPQTICYRV